MDSERWHRVNDLFADVLPLDAAARTRVLGERCVNDKMVTVGRT
jgi:hypothetical protein